MKNQEKIKVDDGIYIKRDDMFGKHYRLVYPPVNEDNSWNKMNLFAGGSYLNLLKVIIFVLLMVSLVLVYKKDMSSCVEINNKLYEQIQGMDLTDSGTGFEPTAFDEWLEENEEGWENGVG